jgi:hypothetical protein
VRWDAVDVHMLLDLWWTWRSSDTAPAIRLSCMQADCHVAYLASNGLNAGSEF